MGNTWTQQPGNPNKLREVEDKRECSDETTKPKTLGGWDQTLIHEEGDEQTYMSMSTSKRGTKTARQGMETLFRISTDRTNPGRKMETIFPVKSRTEILGLMVEDHDQGPDVGRYVL